jgi:hypothetical protein
LNETKRRDFRRFSHLFGIICKGFVKSLEKKQKLRKREEKCLQKKYEKDIILL